MSRTCHGIPLTDGLCQDSQHFTAGRQAEGGWRRRKEAGDEKGRGGEEEG